jgi:hypothetical protein
MSGRYQKLWGPARNWSGYSCGTMLLSSCSLLFTLRNVSWFWHHGGGVRGGGREDVTLLCTLLWRTRKYVTCKILKNNNKILPLQLPCHSFWRSFIKIFLGECLPSIAFWNCGFESCQGHGCLSVVSVVLSDIGFGDGPIPRPEEFYWLCSAIVCDLETSRLRRSWTYLDWCARGGKKFFQMTTNLTHCCHPHSNFT